MASDQAQQLYEDHNTQPLTPIAFEGADDPNAAGNGSDAARPDFDRDARQASSFRARRIAPAAQTPCRSLWGALLLNILANNADRGASATSSEVARRP